MKKNTFLLLNLLFMTSAVSAREPQNKEIENTMKRATQYMMDVVSYDGAFVWNYLPDFSRSWGELEARRTMVWIQPPGTPAIGHLLLDAYHATEDEYYYEQACRVARKLIEAQHPAGGWNYVYDCAGEDSLKVWYSTIGRQAWRLEEFQHYYGNATFDDEGTMQAAKLLLRLYLEKRDETFRPALDRSLSFVLESQYPMGGWPQRFPLRYDHVFKGQADYSSFITFNDEVAGENIEFLIQCYKLLDMPQLRENIIRALNSIILLQQGRPYAGWADQYTVVDMQPAHARSYEPRAINTATTAKMIRTCIEFYQLTGETKFLTGIPAALEFLESQRLPAEEVAKWHKSPRGTTDVLMARFIDPDTGKPHYVHRTGGNVANGNYYTDQDITGTIAHYSSAAYINMQGLYDAYEEALRIPRETIIKTSPLLKGGYTLPRYYHSRPAFQTPQQIVESLNTQGYWLSPIRQVSNPYLPVPENMEASSDTIYRSTMVGDRYDTSPYTPKTPLMGISTDTYIRNMTTLIQTLISRPKAKNFDKKHSEGNIAFHTIKGKNGLEASITNFGARVVSLYAPDSYGRPADMVCGFDSIADYLNKRQNFGALVGRYIGRILNAQFTIDGETHHLQASGGGHCSHGGKPGFANRVWKVEKKKSNRLVLRYRSPDGECGFPGNLDLTVTYTITDDNALRIDYEARTDRPTVLNPSNHSFFNISGRLDDDILAQELWIDGDSIAEYDARKCVTGRMLPVAASPFDFRTPKAIGQDIDADHAQLKVTGGYDHCYRLNHGGSLDKPVARLSDPTSGRIMEVFTTEPGMQIYTANGHNGSIVGKQGITYPYRNSICFETMHFPDSPNKPQFPSTVLRPGETFRSTTIYRFSAEKREMPRFFF